MLRQSWGFILLWYQSIKVWLGSLASKLLLSRCAHCKIPFLSFIACFLFPSRPSPLPSSPKQTLLAHCKHQPGLSSLFWGTKKEILSAPLAPGSCPVLLAPFSPSKYDSPEQRWVIKVSLLHGLCAQPYQPVPRDCFPGSQWQDLLLEGLYGRCSFSLPSDCTVLHK